MPVFLFIGLIELQSIKFEIAKRGFFSEIWGDKGPLFFYLIFMLVLSVQSVGQ